MSSIPAPGSFEEASRRQAWARTVGPRFARAFRERRTVSQQHVAVTMALIYGHTSWRQTTVGKVETGEREVKLAEAVALAEIIGVPLEELLGDPNGEYPEEA